MAFAGYLIKLGGSEGTVLPLEYMQAESYQAVVNQIENANIRSITGLTYRRIAEHAYAKVTFNTRVLNNTSLASLNALIRSFMTDQKERKILIEFYHPETDEYIEANCYMPDVQYTIRKIEDPQTIVYAPLQFTFIEY